MRLPSQCRNKGISAIRALSDPPQQSLHIAKRLDRINIVLPSFLIYYPSSCNVCSSMPSMSFNRGPSVRCKRSQNSGRLGGLFNPLPNFSCHVVLLKQLSSKAIKRRLTKIYLPGFSLFSFVFLLAGAEQIQGQCQAARKFLLAPRI
jgi:hypothetical protein